MKLSQLLATRQLINRQANLANLAYAYLTLKRLADRVETARLRGRVRLQQAPAVEDQYWIALSALEGSQAVLEEHFGDEDIMDLADAIAFAIEGEFTEISFSLEKMRSRFVAPLQQLLAEAGITIDLGATADVTTDWDADL